MKAIKTYWPLLFLTVVILVVFRKFFFQGFLPVPYNIMVSWFFPYNAGGWAEHVGVIPHKGGLFAGDVFRQMIPWKMLSLEQIFSGEWPLWNPYAFSGEPLLANIQATILHPVSLIFLIIRNFDMAWAIYIVLAPIVASLGMYVWGQAMGWSRLASVSSAMAFAFSGHMLSWLEWGVVAHTMIWLPWLMYGLLRFMESGKRRYLPLLGFSAYSTILGGYPQNAIYALIIGLIYFLFLIWPSNQSRYKKWPLRLVEWRKRLDDADRKLIINKLVGLVSTAVVTIGLAMPQLIPTYQLYQYSALNGQVSEDLFLKTQLHPFRLINFFASEYFGNRIYDNYWGGYYDTVDYPQASIFVGATSAILILLGVWQLRGRWLYFSLTLITLGLVIGVDTPLSDIAGRLGIPMISTGVAAGSLVLTTFGLVVLTGLSAHVISRQRLPLTSFGLATGVLQIFVSTVLFIPSEYRSLVVKQIALPLVIMGGVSTVLLITRIFSRLDRGRYLMVGVVLLGYLGENVIFAHRLLSFSPPAYSYPSHVLIEEMRERAGLYRVAGFWDTKLFTNLPTAWKLYSPEGYNPLHPLWYQELASGQLTQGFPETLARSDADIYPDSVEGRNRFMTLTSTKFIAARVTDPLQLWEEEPLKYSSEFFELVWQQDLFKIYSYKHALDRVGLYTKYQVLTDKQARLDYLYSPDFVANQELVLENIPEQLISKTATGSATIVDYRSNRVTIKTDVSGGNMLLLLTDMYYPSWQVLVNSSESRIYRANHAFRAVVVPEGESTVEYIVRWP